ncbi:MAG: eukaryotic-like serine/threonine-protein kinase [Acidobacteriota bacterium]|nr:eukaryotic-like serine/threonine-protein kinase [Acidobacteriota bacterium]
MGEVYLAQDTKLDRTVALKILPADVASDQKRMGRFVQEAKAASALNQPNIITIHEIEEIDSVNLIATEYIDGETLRERMSRSPLTIPEVLDVAAQVAAALSAAHEAGIVHRDIKPENIMLRRDRLVKVLDFGLAKLAERQTVGVDSEAATRALVNTAPGVVMGTPGYMSPEQARGLAVDARTDIWSLGVVLYEMVTGRTPFAGETASDIIAAILKSEPVPLARLAPGVPVKLEEIVSKALEKDREERYQGVKDLLVDLRRLKKRLDFETELGRTAAPDGSAAPTISTMSGGQTTATSVEMSVPTAEQVARKTSSAEYLATEIKRHKKGAVVALAALVVAVAGLAFVLYKFSAKKPAPFQSIKITKLTNIGNATAAQISPNGEYVAHVLYEGGKNSVRVWDVATKSSVEIVPSTEDNLVVAAFSPDSRYIYYRRGGRGQPSAIYQVAVLGGTAKKILERGNSSGFTLSPDGKQFAFVLEGPGERENSLMLVNADGTGERALATRKGEERFGTYESAWSPDGKMIACGIYVDGTNMTIAAVSVADATVKPITSQKWLAVNRAVWLRDGSGLIFSAVEQDVAQIWYISYPEGEVRRITNDANEYGSGSVSITADSSTIATVQIEYISNIFVAPASDVTRAKQITPGVVRTARGWGISWTPDGKIVHSTIASGNTNLWIINADGTGNRQLTNETEGAIGPLVSPDGRYVVFNSMRSGRYNLWRMDVDGSHPKQLTDGGDDEAPCFSPDGHWVIYDAVATSDLRKVPIDGGDSVRLTDRRVTWPTVSPKDGMIAGLYRTDDNSPRRLTVFPPEGGTPVKSFDLPPGAFGGARWTPDGRAVIYLITRAETSSLWSQSLDGGAPKQLADFSPEQIFSFDLSRDGRWLAFARGTIIRDVILITDSKQ